MLLTACKISSHSRSGYRAADAVREPCGPPPRSTRCSCEWPQRLSRPVTGVFDTTAVLFLMCWSSNFAPYMHWSSLDLRIKSELIQSTGRAGLEDLRRPAVLDHEVAAHQELQETAHGEEP